MQTRCFEQLAATCLMLLSAATCAADQAPTAPCDLHYTVQAQFGPTQNLLNVTLRGVGSASDSITLAINAEWAGVDNFADAIRKLRHDEMPLTLKDGAVTLKTPPNKPFAIQYQLETGVPLPDADVKRNHRDSYRNQIGAGWAQFFGYGAWLIPSHLAQRNDLRLCVDVAADPDQDATVASSFNAPTALRAAMPALRIATITGNPQRLQEALYVITAPGSVLRFVTRPVAGGMLSFSLRGKWKFDDDAFADAARSLVLAHRNYFGDHDFPHFLIALSPNGHADGSFGGTAVHNAFSMHAAKSFDIKSEAFNFLIGHEHLHTWMPERFGSMGEDEARRYWFSEGFTNFLTHRLLLKAGAFDLPRYAQWLNTETISRLASSPVATADNHRVASDFFKSQDIGRLPYLRGELLALRWDAMLRQSGKPSLPRVLQTLLQKREEMVSREASGTDHTGAVPRLVAALKAQGIDAQTDIDTFIERGAPMPLEASTLGPCFEGSPTRVGRFELGFDMAATQAAKAVVGLIANSAAAKAGVREGDTLGGLSVQLGNTRDEASISVLRDGKTETIRFIPVSSETVSTWTYAVKPNATTQAGCRDWINL
jgi:predicted metalloprotease with PDZ domain